MGNQLLCGALSLHRFQESLSQKPLFSTCNGRVERVFGQAITPVAKDFFSIFGIVKKNMIL